MKKLFLFCFLFSIAGAIHAGSNLSGAWDNNENPSASLAKIIVSQKGDAMQAKAYGHCKPINCEWGTASVDMQQDGSMMFGYVQQGKIISIQLESATETTAIATVTTKPVNGVDATVETLLLEKVVDGGNVWKVVQ